MVETYFCLVYGLTVVIFLIVFLLLIPRPNSKGMFAAASSYVSATLAIRQTINNLVYILTPKSGDTQIVAEQSLQFEILFPYRTGWFWSNGIPITRSFINVKVPIGYVAQLNETNAPSRYFESSSLEFISDFNPTKTPNEDNSESKFVKIQFLKRAETWTFKINSTEAKKKPVQTSECIPISATCTVQTQILPAGCTQQDMNVVFSEIEFYMQEVQNTARGVLFDLAKKNEYNWFIEHHSEILEELNKTWKSKNESTDSKINQICDSYFIAVVISPLVGMEYARIGGKIKQKHNIANHMTDANVDSVEAVQELIRNPLANACRDMQREFDRFGEKLDVAWLVERPDDPGKGDSICQKLQDGFKTLADQTQQQCKAQDPDVKKIGDRFFEEYDNDALTPLVNISNHIDAINAQLSKLLDEIQKYEK